LAPPLLGGAGRAPPPAAAAFGGDWTSNSLLVLFPTLLPLLLPVSAIPPADDELLAWSGRFSALSWASAVPWGGTRDKKVSRMTRSRFFCSSGSCAAERNGKKDG
jgi:hypothetical protein